MTTPAETAQTPEGGRPDGRDQVLSCSVWRDASGAVRRDLRPRGLRDAVGAGGTLWVDVDATDRAQHAVLENVFGFHPLSIEDTLNPKSRVKLEEYDEYLFAIIRVVQFCEETEDPYDIDTVNLCCFLGRDFLVTVHAGDVPAVSEMRERLLRSPDLLGRGPARLMHALMDESVDAYFPIIDQLDDLVDDLEERIFVRVDETAMRDAFAMKRLVLSLRRHLAPQREVFNMLTNRPSPYLPSDTQLYFRDIYDHVLRINDALDTFRELLSNTMDSYLSQVSNRLGSATKGLSLVATLSVPFVMVSGMWGMNFARIPLSDHPHGFVLMLVLQLVMGVALVGILRWRKLL